MSRAVAGDDFVRVLLPPPGLQPDYIFGLPELRYPERLNAAAALIETGDAEAFAVINDQGAWTYREMRECSDRIARLLVEEEALIPGNRVLLRGPNTAMLLAAWLGVLKAGGIVVATMPILRAGEIATILQAAAVTHAIVDSRCSEDYAQAAIDADRPVATSFYDGDFGTGILERRLRKVRGGFPAADTGRDDPALIAFTSGTTGRPKGCVHYHRDILAAADTFARHILDPSQTDRWACSAPIAFTFGLGMLVIFPWRFGGTAVTIEQPGPKTLLAAIGKHQVTVLATAPTAYKAMLSMLDDADVTPLRVCVSAGEHLPAATWQAWLGTTGFRIVNGIGSTEMMHVFISAAGDDIRPGSTGRAVPGYQAVVLDESGRPLTRGVGRLAVRGPTGCRYLGDPRQSDYVIAGWNVTGDTYRVDEEGYFWYMARSDDMIVSSGYNIAAPEVEIALHAHPAVAECAVVGVPCEQRGQQVKAFVVPAAGHTPGDALAKALQDHVKAVIAPYKYPRAIVFVRALPKTQTGKIKRFALRDLG